MSLINTLAIKRRVTGAAGAPTGLVLGELAYNQVDNTLYYGFSSIALGTVIPVPIAGSGAFMSLSGSQIVEGDKTFNGQTTFGGQVVFQAPVTFNNSDFNFGNFASYYSLSSLGSTVLSATNFVDGVTVNASGVGSFLVPTVALSDDSNAAASTAYVHDLVDDVINSLTSFVTLTGSQTVTGDKTFTGQTTLSSTTASANATVDLSGAGSVLVPTVATSDDSDKAASTGFVHDLVDGALSALTNFVELTGAQTIDGDKSFLGFTRLNGAAGEAGSNFDFSGLNIGGLVGTFQVPTVEDVSTRDQQAATTTFVHNAIDDTLGAAAETKLVSLSGTQVIDGAKTFVGGLTAGSSGIGNAMAFVLDSNGIIDTTGALFVLVPNLPSVDDSDKAANTAFVHDVVEEAVASLATASNFVSLSGIQTITGDKTFTGQTSLSATTFTGTVDLDGNVLTGLATPVSDSDAATKYYVDGVATSLNIHGAVEAATTEYLKDQDGSTATYQVGGAGTGPGDHIHIALNDGEVVNGETTTYAIDGVTLKLNQRILVKNQQSALENGVYVVSNLSDAANDNFAVLLRATDYDNSLAGSVHSGDFVFVTEGTVNNSHGFVLISEGTGTDGNSIINTDNIEFTQFSGTGQILEGSGISINGNEISVDTRLANLNSLTVSGGVSALSVLVGASDVEKITISSDVVTLLSNNSLQGLQDQLQITALSGLVVDTVQVDVSTLRTDLNALSGSASDSTVTTALRTDLDSLSGLVVNTVQVDVSTLRTDLDSLSGLVVDTVQVDISTLRTDVNTISGGLGSMSSQNSDSVSITGGSVFSATLSAVTIINPTFTSFVLDLGEI